MIEGSPSHGFCYTAMHFTDDALLLAYCAGKTGQRGNILGTTRIRRIEL